MNYDRALIRDLRLRLGMTQADLARRLNCSTSAVVAWEAGESYPERHHTFVLELLEKHAEAASEDLQFQPFVESYCQSSEIEQVTLAELKEIK